MPVSSASLGTVSPFTKVGTLNLTMWESIIEHPIVSCFIVMMIIGGFSSINVEEQQEAGRRASEEWNKRVDDHRRNSGQR